MLRFGVWLGPVCILKAAAGVFVCTAKDVEGTAKVVEGGCAAAGETWSCRC